MKKVFWLWALAAVLFSFGAGGAAAVFSAPLRTLPVIMYHSVREGRSGIGKYTVSADSVRSDLEYLYSHGYETVTAAELIAWVDGSFELPQKPVLLTFDDGFYDNLSCLLPVLEEFEAHAVVAVVGKYTEEAELSERSAVYYSYLAKEDILALWNSGRAEIANHSYNMHETAGRLGITRGKNEEYGVWARAFINDTEKNEGIIEAVTGLPCELYAYPFGYTSDTSDDILKALGYGLTVTCAERVNRIEKGDASCLYSLGRFNRSGLVSTSAFMKKAGIE